MRLAGIALRLLWFFCFSVQALEGLPDSLWITREEWGARPPAPNITLPKGISDFSLGEVTGIVIHQTESPVTWGMKQLERFFRDEASGPHFRDIAYHFVICLENGYWRVYEGRAGSQSDKMKLGMHALDNNPGNIGIAVMGHFKKDAIPAELKLTLRQLIGRLNDRSPGLRYLWGHGELKTLKRDRQNIPADEWISGHTNCPGPPLMQFVREMRKEFNLSGENPRLAAAPEQNRILRIRLPIQSRAREIILRFKSYGSFVTQAFASADFNQTRYQGIVAGAYGQSFQALLWHYLPKRNPTFLLPHWWLGDLLRGFDFESAGAFTENPGEGKSELPDFDRASSASHLTHLAITFSQAQLRELAHYDFAQSAEIENASEIQCQSFDSRQAYVSFMQIKSVKPEWVTRTQANCGIVDELNWEGEGR